MYSKVNTDMNFVEREKEVEQFWKEDNTFKKSMEHSSLSWYGISESYP